MATFQERLQQAISDYGGRYDPVMRRSFQTVLMFEANRCLKGKLPTLRPFQRKLALFDHTNYLLGEISGKSSIVGLERQGTGEEILWRTGTSKEPLNPESMWVRACRITKDVEKVANQVRQFMRDSSKITAKSTHDDICRLFLEDIYDKSHSTIPRGSDPYPIQFEFTHNHLFLAYKIYYRKGILDANFPTPRPREIKVPREKPPGGLESYKPILAPTTEHTCRDVEKENSSATNSAPREAPLIVAAGQMASAAAATNTFGRAMFTKDDFRHHMQTQQQLCNDQTKEQRRRETLREIKDHMDLLTQFEGIIDKEILRKRKRDLFFSLPPPPLPQGNDCVGKKCIHAYKSPDKQGSDDEKSDK